MKNKFYWVYLIQYNKSSHHCCHIILTAVVSLGSWSLWSSHHHSCSRSCQVIGLSCCCGCWGVMVIVAVVGCYIITVIALLQSLWSSRRCGHGHCVVVVTVTVIILLHYYVICGCRSCQVVVVGLWLSRLWLSRSLGHGYCSHHVISS